MKKWEILHKAKNKKSEFKTEDLIEILLENRGVKTKSEKEEFLNPSLQEVTPKNVGIDSLQLKKALKRITDAIAEKEQIIVFGDYDVDGITGCAILWETLHKMKANVLPFIPHRVDEGYGLSVKALENEELLAKNPSLIITVDNGIVATDAVAYAKEKKIDVIITDHHMPDKKLPAAFAIVHTTQLCGAGVAYLLAKEIKKFVIPDLIGDPEEKLDSRFRGNDIDEDVHLELATLGTVADLVPLTGANRTIVKYGLPLLPKTKRVGLQELYKNAGLKQKSFKPYEIGFVIAPRLNASGRIESAMDSLRLLCTTNRVRAEELAAKLELVNKERQQLLKDAKEHAIAGVREQGLGERRLLFVAHENYAQGVIGLVAGKLVEEFYRPAIVVSIAETHSKASVRSVSGFNIIEFLRLHADHFINVGGHPMAAGFTVETAKIELLQQLLEEKAAQMVSDEMLQRSLKIDCLLDLQFINQELYFNIQTLAPFGMSNPEPTFATKDAEIVDIRIMGKDGSHLKLVLKQKDSESFEAVGFGMGALAGEIHKGDKIQVAYTIDENYWNGNTKLQLKIKDIQ